MQKLACGNAELCEGCLSLEMLIPGELSNDLLDDVIENIAKHLEIYHIKQFFGNNCFYLYPITANQKDINNANKICLSLVTETFKSYLYEKVIEDNGECSVILDLESGIIVIDNIDKLEPFITNMGIIRYSGQIMVKNREDAPQEILKHLIFDDLPIMDELASIFIENGKSKEKTVAAIFLDVEGVLLTLNQDSPKFIEEKIKLIKKIYDKASKKYDEVKIVLTSSSKNDLDITLRELLIKYGLNNPEIFDTTPTVYKYTDNNRSMWRDMWKEDEIRLYLMRHPEITNYCIIDDDPTYSNVSELDKVRDHLVKVDGYNKENLENEGLLPKHIPEVMEVLDKENHIRKLIMKKRKKLSN